MATSPLSKLWGRGQSASVTTSSSQSVTLPPSPEGQPKPAHERQCSSPSFVETYARYVERLRREDKFSGEGSQHQQHGGQTIMAAFHQQEAVLEDSPDTRKDTTDSSYSSWPGLKCSLMLPQSALICFRESRRDCDTCDRQIP